MGLDKGTFAAQLEERWVAWTIEKDVHTSSVTLRINSVTGYFQNKGTPSEKWCTMSERWTHVIGEPFVLISQITPKMLGLTDTAPLVNIIETVVYGILSEEIPLTSALTVRVKDADGTPLEQASFILKDMNGKMVLTGKGERGVETVLASQAMLAPTLEISAEGYTTQTVKFSKLQGKTTRTVTLTKAAGA